MKPFAFVFFSLLVSAQAGFAGALAERLAAARKPETVIKGASFDGSGMVYNKRWKSSKISKEMIAWEGEHLAFLTLTSFAKQLDDDVMKAGVALLNAGWLVYEHVVPGEPRKGKSYKGKPVIVAIPRNTSVSLGQGAIGSTGIDVASFYDRGYGVAEKGDMEWYYFYEMGRNWFLYALQKKISRFDSAFAVHMGSVAHRHALGKGAMGEGELEEATSVLDRMAATKAITFNDLVHKDAWYGGGAHGKKVIGAIKGDFNACYNAMLTRLGNYDLEFLRRYHAGLLKTGDFGHGYSGAYQNHAQCLNWLVASCSAAQRDVSGDFVRLLKMPLNSAALERFSELDWRDPNAPEKFFESEIPVEDFFVADKMSPYTLAPRFRGLEAEGDKLHVSFERVGTGMKSTGKGAISGFRIMGEDGKLVPASAAIVGRNTIVLAAEGVRAPFYVEYGGNSVVNGGGVALGPFSNIPQGELQARAKYGTNFAYAKAHVSSDPGSGGWDQGLTDGHDAQWTPRCYATGFRDFPKHVTVDLGRVETLGFGRFGVPRIGATKTILLQLSKDGKSFATVGQHVFKQWVKQMVEVEFPATDARYVRLLYKDRHDKQAGVNYHINHCFTTELQVFAPQKK